MPVSPRSCPQFGAQDYHSMLEEPLENRYLAFASLTNTLPAWKTHVDCRCHCSDNCCRSLPRCRTAMYTLFFILIDTLVIDLIGEGGFAGKRLPYLTSKPEIAKRYPDDLGRPGLRFRGMRLLQP